MSERATRTYGPGFYAENIRDRARYTALGDCVHELIEPAASVLDVGCGCGLLIERLQELGHVVDGAEGSAHGIEAAPESVRNRISQLDLTRIDITARIAHTADVVICIEVAEHLPAEAADALVHFVSRAATKQIIWSAAPPGQGGLDHINEQPPAYWLDRFARAGWAPDLSATERLQRRMRDTGAQHAGYAHNFYVLRTS